MKPNEAAQLFEARFLAVLVPKATDGDWKKLDEFIGRLARPDTAQACLQRYLDLFAKHETDQTRSRTMATFYLVLKRRIEVADKQDKFVDSLEGVLKSQQKPFPPLRERYGALSRVDQEQILKLLAPRKGPPKSGLSVIAELKDAYRKRFSKDASSQAELLDFDPLPDEKLRRELRREYDVRLQAYNDAFNTCVASPEQLTFFMLRSESIAFWSFVKAQRFDGLRLFQLLRYWRLDHVHRVSSYVDEIAYVQIAACLLSYAAVEKVYAVNVNRRGFTAEEHDFILRPFRGHTLYYSSYEGLLANYFKNVPVFLDQCDLFLRLQIFGRRTKSDLATEEELVHIVGSVMTATQQELDNRYFEIGSSKATRWYVQRRYKLAQIIGGALGIVYFEGTSPQFIYVEFVRARGVVFKIPMARFIGYAENEPIYFVYEGTKHLERLIPAYFELLMYMPGIVERGFIGLLQVLIDPAVEAVAAEVLEAFGFDESKAGLWVAGMALLTHKVKPGLGKATVRDVPETELAEGHQMVLGAGLTQARGVARTGTDGAQIEARGVGAGLAQTEARGVAGTRTDVAHTEARAVGATPDVVQAEKLLDREVDSARGLGKAPNVSRTAEEGMVKTQPPVAPRQPLVKSTQDGKPRAVGVSAQTAGQRRGDGKKAMPGRQAGTAEEAAAEEASGKMTGGASRAGSAARGTSNRGLPIAPPAGVKISPLGYRSVEDGSPLLNPLKSAGFRVEPKPAPALKSLGGPHQRAATGLDYEFKVTAPSGTEAKLDGLALDTAKPGSLMVVEAKAGFAPLEKSKHLIFYPDKVEQLAEQLAIVLESKGLLSRIRIVCNKQWVAEVYGNMAAQQVARELKQRFRQQVREYLERSKDKAVKNLLMKDLDEIVERHIDFAWPTTTR